MKIELISHSPSETVKIGKKIGKFFQKGNVIGLSGNLGAGKTTLIKGIAQGLGVDEKQYVRSPSFVLAHQYEGKIPVYHMDLYRLSPKQTREFEYEEYIFGDGVCIIEWAEKMGEVFTREGLNINLEFLKENQDRKITIKAEGKYAKLIKELQKKNTKIL